MSQIIAIIVAGIAFAIIAVRCVCVVYKAHWTTHPRGKAHFAAFGYSYIALASAAGCALLYVVTTRAHWGEAALWLFLLASAGMILFDRRPQP